MTPPVVHSLREQIREHIVEGIVSGRWKPGERIVERRIAVELEVSQTPVREALRELETLRLIESAPNKGVRVRELSAADLEEIYPVRAGLEQIAAELAAPRLAADADALAALEPHVRALYEADRASDGEAQVRHTVAFHRELVRASGNSVLLHTWESLGIEVWTALSIRWLGTVQQSYAEEHEAVVAAFRRRDPHIAEVVKAHVLGCAPAPRDLTLGKRPA
jgi:DNA-binding GntR family transcriptional regulator